ncbi:BT_3987 domain-containing protein [Pedobacter miscanthi]|uniref:F5/8 type C domain-containing protein n=1 Tax=Pedobacter miscanthi TaxID=2259170 RepID=A0A366KKT8_9SPHI|nr:DUF1735 domain-containing protein [Pedobacter miscanthi]RBQ02307.1 hypothetical protein DRW42_27330 [Pedobacter miscanthi]
MIIQRKYKTLFFLYGLISVSLWYGCKDNVDLPDQPLENYVNVYMPQGVNGPVTTNLKVKDNLVQTVVFGADYGGYGYPDADVPVSFTVDNSLVAAYNTANKTNYQVLPASAYTLSASSSVIPKGKLATEPLKVNFKTTGTGAMNAFTTYLLPITLSSSTVKVREALKTVYYVVTALPDLADYPNFDRSKFSIVDFSSQEANGEGPNNGRAVFALDGVNSTFWHSQWQNGTASPPHFLTIDMGELKTFHGLSFLARQSNDNGKPNEVNLKLSTDNVTWTDYGTLNLANTQALQSVFFPSAFNKQARYFKITINSSYGSNVTHLAELYAF